MIGILQNKQHHTFFKHCGGFPQQDVLAVVSECYEPKKVNLAQTSVQSMKLKQFCFTTNMAWQGGGSTSIQGKSSGW
jgi:hypothetical protein